MTEPTPEHRWLDRLVGEWTGSSDVPGPDGKPPADWTENVASLGGIWVIAEGKGDMPDGSAMTTIMTLGFDPAKGRYIGTFVGSMMAYMWHYDGAVDTGGNVLTLDCEGPDFADTGRTAKYQDIITFVSDDHRTLTSRTQAEDGSWQQVMHADYRRRK